MLTPAAKPGFDIEIAKDLAKDLLAADKVEFVLTGAANRIEYVRSLSRPHLFNFTQTPERAEVLRRSLHEVALGRGPQRQTDYRRCAIEDRPFWSAKAPPPMPSSQSHPEVKLLHEIRPKIPNLRRALKDSRGVALAHDNACCGHGQNRILKSPSRRPRTCNSSPGCSKGKHHDL